MGEVDKVVNVGPVSEGVPGVGGVSLAALGEPVLKVAAHHVVTHEGLDVVTPLGLDQGCGHQRVPASVPAPPAGSGQEETGSWIAIRILVGLRLRRIPVQDFFKISQWVDLFA